MLEWILSSGALILIVMTLRRLLRGRISLRLQYALWALVLVRLLVPFNLPANPISVQNIVVKAPVEQVAQVRLPVRSYDNAYEQVVQSYQAQGVAVEKLDPVELDAQATERMKSDVTLGQMLTAIWIGGAAAVMGFILWSNHCFRQKLRRNRERLDVPWVKLPVYVSEGLDSPCIFGLIRPAIYLTPDVAGDETRLRHILEHEMTHYFHGDFIIAPLRCLALALHWFDPLVWWAVKLSRQDGELACDEATIRRLGEGERLEYGRTLIHLTCERNRPADYILAATTMLSDKKSIKERVVMIAKKPKTAFLTLIAVLLAAALAVGCTFGGARETAEPSSPDVPEETTLATEPDPEDPDSLVDRLFTAEPADPQLHAAAEGVLLERLSQTEPEARLLSAGTTILTKQWYYYTLCRTDYETETAGKTESGRLYSMWYPYTDGEETEWMLMACDPDGAFLTGQWWRDRLLPEPVEEYPEYVMAPLVSQHDVTTALPVDRPLYCAVRGEVEYWLHYRLWTLFPNTGAGIWLADNVPVDLGREEGYYVYRLEYYIAQDDHVYFFRDYLVIERRTEWAKDGEDWIYHGILTEEELRAYGVDPAQIREAEPAPYVDTCR